jgi:hypothetical protein
MGIHAAPANQAMSGVQRGHEKASSVKSKHECRRTSLRQTLEQIWEKDQQMMQWST